MHPAAFREILADLIANEKAYNVPRICTSIGLAEGEEGEAFGSKFRYARKRLDEIADKDLVDVASRLEGLIDSETLRNIVRESRNTSPSDTINSLSLERLGSEVVNRRWADALLRRDDDPEGAITLARTLLEDLCKTIIIGSKENYAEDDDLPKLYRRTAALLNLAPDLYTEQIFKKILGNCQSIVESLGTIRNKLGDAHSVGPLRARATPRHATLAVNLAGAMATFLADTWQSRSKLE